MKYRKSIIVLTLAIFLFAMATVSASEIDTAIASEDTSQMGLSDSDKMIEDNLQTSEEKLGSSLDDKDGNVSVQSDADILGDDTATYSDLANEIGQSGNIKLKHKNYIYTGGGTISINADGKTIDGNGAVIDMNGSATQALIVYSWSVTLKNLTFINCNYHAGGAVEFRHSGTVTDCNFINNRGGSQGGGLYFNTQESGSTVKNSNFSNNYAYQGGGIRFAGSTGSTVTNCTFIKNSASSGAGLYMNWGTVTDCTFIENTASLNAGAIDMTGGTVTNCTFINNKAYRYGGAIYIDSDGSTVTNCYFDHNSIERYGGAIFCYYWSSTADTCIFKTGSDSIYNIRTLSPTLNVDDFVAPYNSGKKITFDLKTNRGQAVPNGNISIKVYDKKDNSLVGEYSCLSSEGWTVDLPVGSYYAIFNTEYRDFKPINRTVSIYKPMSDLQALINNAQAGDTITLDGDYYSFGKDLQDGIRINKTLTIDGQGHKIDANHLMRIFQVGENVDVTIKNLNFVNGWADRYSDGGVILGTNAYVTVINCTFENNSAYRGAAVYLWTGDSTFINCTFIENTAYDNGGALNFWSVGSNVTNCTFINNKGTTGGAVYFSNVGNNVTNCYFEGNSAETGGAIFCFAGWATNADTCIFKTSSDSTFNTRYLSPTLNVDDYVAPYKQGDKLTFDLKTNRGMTVTNGNILISVYDNNDKSLVGEYSCLSSEGWTVDLPVGSYYAIFNTEYKNFKAINRTVTITLPNNTFIGLNRTINSNKQVVNESNGVLQARIDSENYAVIELTQDYYFNPDLDADFVNGIVIDRPIIIHGNGHTINGNGKARIFQITGEGVDLKNITFINGHITGNGGAVLFSQPGIIENCNFINNFASREGGAISFEKTGNVINCNFSDNTAGTSGGGIQGGIATMCTFMNNKANVLGDAMRNATAIDCTFINDKVADSRVFATSPSGLVLISSNYITGAINEYLRTVDFNLAEILPANLSITDAADSIVDFIKGKNYEFNVTDLSDALDKALNGTTLDGKTILKSVSEFINGADLILNLSGSTSLLDLLLHDTSLSGKDIFDSISKFINGPNFYESGVIAELDDYLNGTGFKGEFLIESIREFLNGTNFQLNVNQVSYDLDRLLNGTGFSGAGIIGGITEFLNGKKSSFNITDVTNILDSLSNRTGLNVPVIKDLMNFLNGMNGLNMSDVVSGWINDITNIVDAAKGNVAPKPTPSNIIASKVSTTYGTAKKLAITLIDTNGNPISEKAIVVELNGIQSFVKTNSAGKATFTVPKNLAPKTYTAKLKFAGDDKYVAANTAVKVSVVKATPKLTAKSKAFKKAVKTKKYTIVLKTDKKKALKNAKVTIKIKGKTYTAKTNSKGKAVFKITKLTKKGTFKSLVKFKGNKYYKAVTKKVNIKIK